MNALDAMLQVLKNTAENARAERRLRPVTWVGFLLNSLNLHGTSTQYEDRRRPLRKAR